MFKKFLLLIVLMAFATPALAGHSVSYMGKNRKNWTSGELTYFSFGKDDYHNKQDKEGAKLYLHFNDKDGRDKWIKLDFGNDHELAARYYSLLLESLKYQNVRITLRNPNVYENPSNLSVNFKHKNTAFKININP